MKNIVIAAGYATRLGELTKNFPKPLLKIGESTILGRMLDDIDTIPEIDEHVIITNHKFAHIFEDWAREQHYQKKITIVDDGTESNDTRLGAVCDLLYAIDKLQDRGKFFIHPQEEVYAGQVVGEHVHDNDLVVNVTKAKQLTNMRASGADDKARIVPPVIFSLEEALEYIKEDEYVEVTPKSMRMRKIILDHLARKRAGRD